METQIKNWKLPLLADPAIQLVLAWVSLTLLGWPMVQIAGEHGIAAMFIYVFGVWVGLVILLIAVSRSLRRAMQSVSADTDDVQTREKR